MDFLIIDHFAGRYRGLLTTICGTPVQAIWDHKDLTELAWGVREGQNLPQNGLNLALEPSRGPQIGQ